MKISHICPLVGEQMGGSERYVWALSKQQAKNNDVHIYTTTRYLDRVGTSVLNGVTIHKSYAPLTIWNVNPLTYMLSALTKSKSDIFHIHSHLYLTSNQAMLAKILNKRKSLLHIHGGVGLPPYKVSLPKLVVKRFYDKTLGSFTIRNSDFIASVSHSDLSQIAEEYNIPQRRLLYIPNIVDTDIFKQKKSYRHDKKTILFLGDLEPWKGIGSLIKWMRSEVWEDQEIKLRIVGQGSYLPYLLDLQRYQSKFANGISLEVLGPRKHTEIPSILNESDVLILPSYWEGMPTVILEAMACGVPVISTKVGDIPTIIESGKTGYLIDRSFQSFREAVDLVFNNTTHTQSVIHTARELVEKQFSLKNVDHILMKVYYDIIW